MIPQRGALSPPRRQRHAACPCGSGRSLVACCLPWEEALQRLYARLVAFSGTPRVGRLEDRAAAIFWNADEGARLGKGHGLRDSLGFLEWLLHDYAPRRGAGPLLAEYADAADDLSPQEEALLFAMLVAPVRAYEVSEVVGTRGLLLKDLVAGSEKLVGSLGLPEIQIHTDVLVCRLLPAGRTTRSGAGLVVLAGASRGELLEYLRTAYRLARPRRHVSLEDFLDGSPHLYQHYFLLRGRGLGGRAHETLRRMAYAPGLLTYRGTDTSRIQAGLRRQQELERCEGFEDEIRYVWVNLHQATARATIVVASGEVRVSAETREDLADARRFVETCLRGLLQPIGEQVAATPPSPRAVSSRRTTGPPGTAFLAKYLQGWPDAPSPFLDDRTPREACRTRAGRQRVTALLTDLERELARQKRLGRAWADVTPLRDDLGLLPRTPSGSL
jgi:hypothetical protein